MRTSPSFESSSSFEDLDSVSHGSVGATEEDVAGWGVVSTTGSEVDGNRRESAGGFSREYIGEGILIVDGMESAASRDEMTSDLSIPGSESFPSIVGSLTVEQTVGSDVFDLRNTWHVNKRAIFFAGCLILLSFSVVTVLFVRQLYHYQSTVEQLGEKILQLEKEKDELTLPPWVEDDKAETESSLFTLLDNCWVKAKMNVKFGDCSQNSFGLCGAFFHNATRTIGDWFNETFSSSNTEDDPTAVGESEADIAEHDIFEVLAKYPEIMASAIMSATEALSERLISLNLGTSDDKDDLVRASEAVSEALRSAGGAASSELEEMGKDPIKYLADVVDGAWHPGKNSKFSANGIQEASKTITNTMIHWAESLSSTFTDAFSHFGSFEVKTSEDEL